MSTSTNPKIQAIMNEIEAVDPKDPNLVEKLNSFAAKLAAEQRKVRAAVTGQVLDDSRLVDPSEEFACEGCQ